MRPVDIAIGLLAVALVLFTVFYNIRKKRRGESACGYCKGCSASSYGFSRPDAKNEKK